MKTMRKNEKVSYVTNDTTIRKSNELSLSKLQNGLSLQQVQLLSYCIYSTQQKNKTSFHKADFEKFFGIKKYRTKDAFDDAKALLNLSLAFADLKNDNFKFRNVFQEIDYTKGLFEFTWTNILLPHILELQRNFVLLDLMTTSKFTSSYTWKMYEYLKAKHGYWNLKFTKDEIYKLFAVEDVKSYQGNTTMFKKRVLNPVIEELNELTEYVVQCEEIKEGRKVVGFQLLWSIGNVVKLASKKQIDELQLYITTMLDDMDVIFDLSTAKRNEALDLLDAVRKISENVNYSLEEAKVDGLRTLLKQYMKKFQEICISEDVQQKRPEFYNWLEEREDS